MKRHVQTVGVREWAGDDLVELQREPLAALDAFFAEYGPCIVQGCEITARADDSGTFDVAPGLVALEADDPEEGTRRVMTMPFPGAEGIAQPLYLTASVETLTDVYGDGKVKPIAYVYTARAAGVEPAEGVPCLPLTADGGNRFVDVVQDPAHRFISDAERTRWNGILAAAKAYADSVSATGSEAALRSAKEYTDAREVAVLAAADTKDADTLKTAKAYADKIVAALAGSAPETLDTLQELAAALGNDPNFSATVMRMIGERVTTEALNAALEGKADRNGATTEEFYAARIFLDSTKIKGIVGGDYSGVLDNDDVFLANWNSEDKGAAALLSAKDPYFVRMGEWVKRTFWHSGNFDPEGKVSCNKQYYYAYSDHFKDTGGGYADDAATHGFAAAFTMSAGGGGAIQLFGRLGLDQFWIRTTDDNFNWKPKRQLWHSGNFDPGECLRTKGVNGDLDQPLLEMGFQYGTGDSGVIGPYISVGNSAYPLQLTCGYRGGAGGHYNLKFRTRNGDNGTWNPWYTVYCSGNLGPATASADGLMSAADKRKLDGITGVVAAGRVNGNGQVVCTTPGISFYYDTSTKSYSMGFPAIPNPVLQITPFDKDGKTDLWGKVCCVIKTLTTSSAQIVMTDSGSGDHIQAGFCFSLLSC